MGTTGCTKGSTVLDRGIRVSQVIAVCQDIPDILDNDDRMDAIIVDFSNIST
jgi:hypothetical protein